MARWPAARGLQITVHNELWRNWDEESRPTIDVTQTVPPLIARRAVPAVDDDAAGRLADAAAAVAALNDTAAAATGVLGHLSAVLIRADAVASSQIEHITTSSEELAAHLADLHNSDAVPYPTGTELVAANVTTALAAHRSRGAVTAQWLQRLHRNLLAADREIEPRHRGAWRDCPVWIGSDRGNADFEGPPHQQIPQLVDDLVGFTRRVDVHPVLHAAIAHAQFETIHPYVDGNGRIGRLLIHKLLPPGSAPVPAALGLLHDPARYVAGLNSYRDGDLDAWIGAFADAITLGAGSARRLVRRLEQLRAGYHRKIRTRRGSTVPHVIDALLDHPAVTTRTIEDRFGVTAARAQQILHLLADAGILRCSASRAGGRSVWIATDVIDAVDTINAAAQRRPLEPGANRRTPDTESGSARLGSSNSARRAVPVVQQKCLAPCKRGGRCRHPKPPRGQRCAAGHQH